MLEYLKANKLSLILIFGLILITYFNSLGNDFLSDDLAEIVNNPNVGSFQYAVTSHPFSFIRLIFYALAYQIGGLNPVIFRSVNLLLHLLSAFLVFAVFNFAFSKKIATIVALIFAIHPAISEAVVWISGGSYPQYSLFFLVSFLFYLLSSKNSKFYILSILFYVFSFMSHPQMPLALFLIFPLWEFSFGNFKKNWKKTIPYILVTFAYLLIVLSSLPERESTLKSVHYQEGGFDNPLILVPVAISSYFELILFPKNLTLYHSELSFGALGYAIRGLITLLFFGLIFFGFKKNKFIFFWSSFFLIALSPTLNPFRLNWIVAERYLYLPLIGISALFGYGLNKLSENKKYKGVALALLILIILLLSLRTIFRNIDWKNQDNLWLAASTTSPSSPNNHNNLGDMYGRLGNKQKAIEEFQKAIELKPNYGDAYHNLANTYAEIGEAEKALENYQNAIKYNPNLWQSYQNIAALYYQAKQYQQAEEFMHKAIQVNPQNINLRNSLGIVYLGMGEKQKAKEIFNLVLSADPNNQVAKQGLSEAIK